MLIEVDPRFENAGQGDFNLTMDSPLVDSGSPGSPMDPDRSRADIGAFVYYGERNGLRESIANIEIPTRFRIESLYPNPFNPTLTVTIGLPEKSKLHVSIYNVNGQQVATLADDSYPAGYHLLTFDGSDFSSGIYFIRATVPGKMNQLKKVVLMK
jgi:hypothetical protein